MSKSDKQTAHNNFMLNSKSKIQFEPHSLSTSTTFTVAAIGGESKSEYHFHSPGDDGDSAGFSQEKRLKGSSYR